MYSGAMAATIGTHGSRRRDRDEARARSQRAERRQVRGAASADRSGDDQHAAEVSFVRVGRARGSQLAHALARQQLEIRTIELVDDRGRDADVGDHEVAGVGVGRRQDERQLRRRQRDGHRRLDGLPVELVRVGRQAGRQIDRDDWNAEAVDVGDDGLEQSRERRREIRCRRSRRR